MDTVIMGNAHLYEVMKEKDAIYEKAGLHRRGTACGLPNLGSRIRRAGRLGSGIHASRLLQGLGIGTELQF